MYSLLAHHCIYPQLLVINPLILTFNPHQLIYLWNFLNYLIFYVNRIKCHKFQININIKRNCPINSNEQEEGGAFGNTAERDFYDTIKWLVTNNKNEWMKKKNILFLFNFIYSFTFNVTSVNMERIYFTPTVSSFQVVRVMKKIGVHGVHHRIVLVVVAVVLHIRQENVWVTRVKVEIKNISHATLRIVPIMSLTFDNSSAHTLIEHHLRASIITGCHTQKHQILVNWTACREENAFIIVTSLRSSMEHAVMINRWTFALMDSVRYEILYYSKNH